MIGGCAVLGFLYFLFCHTDPDFIGEFKGRNLKSAVGGWLFVAAYCTACGALFGLAVTLIAGGF